MCGGLRGVGLEGSGLQAPDQIHRCLFMADSDRWGSEQIPQWRETAPDPQSVPWKEREVVSLQRTRGRKQREGLCHLDDNDSTLCFIHAL